MRSSFEMNGMSEIAKYLLPFLSWGSNWCHSPGFTNLVLEGVSPNIGAVE